MTHCILPGNALSVNLGGPVCLHPMRRGRSIGVGPALPLFSSALSALRTAVLSLRLRGLCGFARDPVTCPVSAKQFLAKARRAQRRKTTHGLRAAWTTRCPARSTPCCLSPLLIRVHLRTSASSAFCSSVALRALRGASLSQPSVSFCGHPCPVWCCGCTVGRPGGRTVCTRPKRDLRLRPLGRPTRKWGECARPAFACRRGRCWRPAFYQNFFVEYWPCVNTPLHSSVKVLSVFHQTSPG